MSGTSSGSAEAPDELSPTAKLARLVLENCGPLSAAELAREGHLSRDDARIALAELADRDLAGPVCGVCESREEVYALTDAGAVPGADRVARDADDGAGGRGTDDGDGRRRD